MYPQVIQQFLAAERLPDTYGQDAVSWFLPYIEQLKQIVNATDRRPMLLGINGAQGTGKSTLSSLIVTVLNAAGYRTLALSIDDFYLGRDVRKQLAESVHPLLQTRGVPGTHNTSLLQQTLQKLGQASEGQTVPIPRFNKACDDLFPLAAWQNFEGPVDLVILEGWFIGIKAQPLSALRIPINDLEKNFDRQGIWRKYVNIKLHNDYEPLFHKLDRLLVLLAPSFDQVFRWRSMQEQKLRQKIGAKAKDLRLMDEQQLKQFILHFERLTCHGFKTLPDRADTVFKLDTTQQISVRSDRNQKN